MAVSIRTLSGTQVGFDDERLAEIRATFRGAVLAPGDDGYDEARAVHNALFDRRPGLIIRCTGVADVADAVALARDESLLVAVRGGGHSIAGHSACDGGLVIDLSPMTGVVVDAESRAVTVQGGATWGDVDREAQAFGLVVPGGIISTTGVGGITLGGGIGWVHRALGLACDSLRAVQLVTADGQVRRVTADSDADLFWALRGGGGNFGVATAFEFEAHPLGPVVHQVAAAYPGDRAADLLRDWVAWAKGASDLVTSRWLYWTFPDVDELPAEIRGQDCVILAALYAGDAEEGERVLMPLRQMGEPLADLSGMQPYRMAQSSFDPFFGVKGVMRSYWKSLYLDDIDEDGIELISKRCANRPHPMTLVHIPQMGGATSRIAADASAFGDRSAAFMLSVDGNWAEPAQDAESIAWTREFVDEARALQSARGIYLNFSGEVEIGDDLREAAFGANLARLVRVKDRVDPGNLFRLNNNVPPSGTVELPGQRVTVDKGARQRT
jgi:FAD/FMN-containing dehydrogenase